MKFIIIITYSITLFHTELCECGKNLFVSILIKLELLSPIVTVVNTLKGCRGLECYVGIARHISSLL